MTTFTWTGGSENWDTAGDWSPSGPPMASDVASIGGTATTETIMVSNAQAVATVILDNPNAAVAIGGAAGANLTVANTLAIEYGSVGLGGLGTLGATHIRIAAPKGSPTPTNGVLLFLGNGTIGATVENNGTIEAKGQAGSTVDFERKVIGKGSADISGGGTLEFTKKGRTDHRLRRRRRNARTARSLASNRPHQRIRDGRHDQPCRRLGFRQSPLSPDPRDDRAKPYFGQ